MRPLASPDAPVFLLFAGASTSMQIDTTTYRRDLKWGIGSGCNSRPIGVSPSSLIIHTTNGKRGSTFEAEAAFLRDNTVTVSAHYLIGKQGQIVQIVPDYLAAWHAGSTIPGFANAQSIGIENHLTPGENWTSAMRDALTWLSRQLMARYAISLKRVETHRKVAVPAGRKIDPSGMTDATFYVWRDALIPSGARQVIGVRPSIELARFTQLLRTRNAPFAPIHFDVISERIYATCAWLDIDPCFWLALWTHEQFMDRILGNSEVGRATHNPLNIKAYGRWPSATVNGIAWNVYESWQIGCLMAVFHVKQFYGAAGLLHVETIIPVFAPLDPGTYIAAVNADMEAMQS